MVQQRCVMCNTTILHWDGSQQLLFHNCWSKVHPRNIIFEIKTAFFEASFLKHRHAHIHIHTCACTHSHTYILDMASSTGEENPCDLFLQRRRHGYCTFQDLSEFEAGKIIIKLL